MASNFERGGYDVEFVGNEPNHVTCCICLLVLREPMQGRQCGHRFCKSCVNLLDKNNDGTICCPEDRKNVELFEDKGKEREILDFNVKCSNKISGCPWNGELRSIDVHLDGCQYQSNDCAECKEQVLLINFDKHKNEECVYRITKCHICSVAYQFNQQKMHENYPNTCSKCSEQLERLKKEQNGGGDIPAGSLEFILDKLKKLEAKSSLQDEKIKVQELTIRELRAKINEHDINIGLCRNDIFGKFQQMQAQLQSKSINDNPSQIFSDTYIWKINQFRKKMDQAEIDFNGDNPLVRSFYTSHGHRLNVHLHLNGYRESWDESVTIFFQTEDGIFDDVVKWPMRAMVKYCVLSHGNELNCCSTNTTGSGDARSFQKPSNNSQGGIGEDFIPHDEINEVLHKNSLTLKIRVDYF